MERTAPHAMQRLVKELPRGYPEETTHTSYDLRIVRLETSSRRSLEWNGAIKHLSWQLRLAGQFLIAALYSDRQREFGLVLFVTGTEFMHEFHQCLHILGRDFWKHAVSQIEDMCSASGIVDDAFGFTFEGW